MCKTQSTILKVEQIIKIISGFVSSILKGGKNQRRGRTIFLLSLKTLTGIIIYVTQRGIWYPSGELGNSSKAIIKGNMEKNMTNKLILLKNLTKVEFY